jgi:hypothetical protein
VNRCAVGALDGQDPQDTGVHRLGERLRGGGERALVVDIDRIVRPPRST